MLYERAILILRIVVIILWFMVRRRFIPGISEIVALSVSPGHIRDKN